MAAPLPRTSSQLGGGRNITPSSSMGEGWGGGDLRSRAMGDGPVAGNRTRTHSRYNALRARSRPGVGMASMASTDLSYGDYQMEIVLGEKPEELRHEIVEFWKANRALRTGPEERWRRSAEVALIARNGKREIVGVSTVYVRNFRTPDNKYYFYRMFIREGDRVPGMMRFMTLT